MLRTSARNSEGWEEDDANALDEPTTISYGSSADDIESIRKLIRSVSKRELSREARIAVRTIDAVRNGDAPVSGPDLKRMADAADRIRVRKEKASAVQSAVVDWLTREHAERGLVSLARDLGEHNANLLKVIEGKRKPSKPLVLKVRDLIR